MLLIDLTELCDEILSSHLIVVDISDLTDLENLKHCVKWVYAENSTSILEGFFLKNDKKHM